MTYIELSERRYEHPCRRQYFVTGQSLEYCNGSHQTEGGRGKHHPSVTPSTRGR